MKRDRLDTALGELEADGVLDAVQRDRVHEKLLGALFPKTDATARFVQLVGGLGGILLGLGLLFLVAHNWQALGKPVQLGLIIGALVGLHGTGYYLSEGSGRAPHTGRAFTAAGVLGFGAAIALIAQMYHLHSEYPYAVLIWWATGVPFVLYTASVPILYIVTGLAIVWVYWHTGVWIDHLSAYFASGLSALSLVSVGIGAVLVALAGLARRGRFSAFAPHLGGIGAVTTLAAPYVLSFRHVCRYAVEWTPSLAMFVPFLVLGIAALAVAMRATRDDDTRAQLDVVARILGAGALLGLAIMTSPPITVLVANALLVAGIIGLIAYGVHHARNSYVNLGVALFAVTATTRYFEYVWHRLDGAIAFMVTGAVLLALVTLVERRRRAWTSVIEGAQA